MKSWYTLVYQFITNTSASLMWPSRHYVKHGGRRLAVGGRRSVNNEIYATTVLLPYTPMLIYVITKLPLCYVTFRRPASLFKMRNQLFDVKPFDFSLESSHFQRSHICPSSRYPDWKRTSSRTLLSRIQIAYNIS